MKKILINYKSLMVIVVVILFVVAFSLGRNEQTEQWSEKVKNYSKVEQPEESAAAPDVKAEDITITTPIDKTIAQEVSAEFVMAFHAVDAKQPFKYLEDSKPYMTDSAFEKYANIPKRGTLETQVLTPTATDLLPVDLTESKQIWRVGVTSKQLDGEYVFSEYLVELVKEGQEWKVDGVTINE